MNAKFPTVLAFLLLLPIGVLLAQVSFPEEGVEVVPTESEINISPAELQSFLEELMQHKKKRIQRMATYRKSTAYSGQAADAISEQDLKRRIGEMEKLLVQMNERLAALQQNSLPSAPVSTLDKMDLEELKSDLREEIKSIKREVQEQSLNPPPVLLAGPGEVADTAYQKALQGYFMEYASQMIALRRSVDLLEEQSDNLLDKEDYKALEKHLSDIERKIQMSTPSPQKEQPLNRPETAYFDEKFQEIHRLIGELKTAKAQTLVIPPSGTQPDNEQLMAQWNAQFEELRKMIAEIKPGEQTLKEKVITEPAPPDTSYYWLRQLITGKEKRSLFYDNNAYQINQEHLPALQETVSLMQQHGELDVLIVGFTSKKGTPLYNESLSQHRAETVKKYLMKQGIHPSRIFTEYHGVDYEVTDEPQGRRVELLILIRR